VRGAAVREIWKSGEFGIVASLHEMLSSYDVDERMAAAYALGLIGEVMSSLRTLPNVARLVSALRRHPVYAKV